MSSYQKGSNVSLSDHFNLSEFDCHCPQCTITLVEPELIAKLEALRLYIGKPLAINSGYRCQHHQDELRVAGFETSIGPSQHELGRAADVTADGVSGADIEQVARKVGFVAVGVAPNWAHVDLRNDKVRRWVYTK